LTEEIKAELVKIAHQVAENGHVSLRTARRDANEDLKKLEKEKKITEDDRFKAQDEVQKLTDKFIAKIDEALANKEKEIRQG
jgi:ribosome recycling factor